MTDMEKRYSFAGVSLFSIRNRLELRVIAAMERVLPEFPDYIPQELDIEDIYALALNSLPARYAQTGSIVLREPVSEGMLEDAVRSAVETVRERPNY